MPNSAQPVARFCFWRSIAPLRKEARRRGQAPIAQGKCDVATSAKANPAHTDIRDAVAKLCRDFPGEYWRALDRERAYPTAFVERLTKEGFLSVLIPEDDTVRAEQALHDFFRLGHGAVVA